MPEMTQELQAIVEVTESEFLMPGIGKVEGVVGRPLAVPDILGVGSGTATGRKLAETTDAAAKAEVRTEIVGMLWRTDRANLLKLVSRAAASDSTERMRCIMLETGRRLAALVKEASADAGDGGDGAGGKGTVFVEKEEDAAYSDKHFDVGKMKEQMKRVDELYKIELGSHELASQKILKRVNYAIHTEGVWPDPVRVPLSAYSRRKTDRPMTLWARAVWSVVLCAAGVKAKPTSRDDGAGALTGHAPQWANARVAHRLLKSTDEARAHIA